MNINLERFKKRFAELSQYGAIPGGLTRVALSDEDKQARDLFRVWLEEAGLTARVDDIGNIYGHRAGLDDSLAPVLLGSHLDTVYEGGLYDGVIGVLGALEAMQTLNDYHIETKRPIEIVDWTNEECARFEPPTLSSAVLGGQHSLEFAYSRVDKKGTQTLLDELIRIGYHGAPQNRIGEIAAYLEMHIEQGPILDRENLPIAALECIQAIAWNEITIWGSADHAGGMPMDMRRDALVAASRIISKTDETIRLLGAEYSTVSGRMIVEPNVTSIIPGKVVFSQDIRHPDGDKMREGLRVLEKIVENTCTEMGLAYNIDGYCRIDTARFDPRIIHLMDESMETRGYPHKHLISRAGHDAQHMSRIAPTGMIFVRTIGGKSHCIDEKADFNDIEKGTNVLLDTALAIANTF